ncbi:regulatory subunit 6A of 26S proteasome [Hamiltosporidium tvaerminnensis]|uniref:26S proteasome regulatory subunit 6A n=1 Tax=Hamiltosporidium tvaerminnensis TaxID=1176355 RepID=A0A4Q9LZ01_9MICR|nr:regulatory subunit 6A of 26S proteasome [Hamiltosporidium tvaerminnensis]
MSLEKLKDVISNIANEDPEIVDERISLLGSELRGLKGEVTNLDYEIGIRRTSTSENYEKIKLHKTLPYLVATVIEVLYCEKTGDVNVVLMTSTRVNMLILNPGLVDPAKLLPGTLVGVQKESNVILEIIEPEFDTRVKAMELEERPLENYEDIGGLERQIEELNEAVVLPFLHPEKFIKMNIRPPKGVLMYGPPGTGKTLMARACASKTKATFIKLAGTQLVQMYIGEGARLVRDTFALAKKKKPTIIFIDEIDAIGTKRVDSDRNGDREVQRTMLELLNQLDGFAVNDDIKIIAATNRPDILDPALLRSGRLDRKIEFPLPNLEGRKRILQIHSRKMVVQDNVNYEELARSTEGFNGAQCKAATVEAGMRALKKKREEITQNDFMDGIQDVSAAKKSRYHYYT